MSNRKRAFFLISVVVAGCLIMGLVDGVLSPNYKTKSIIKIISFLLLPLSFGFFDKEIVIKDMFKINKKGIFFLMVMGIMVYVLIVGGYFILRPFFDFTNVTSALEGNIGVNRDNFIYVAIYISLFNSLLEEFFFRGIAYITLKEYIPGTYANIFSALVFSIYHIAIMNTWFSPFLYLLLIIGLFIAGLFFNWLNEKRNNIYPSWFVHIFANLGINTIGFILFKIL